MTPLPRILERLSHSEATVTYCLVVALLAACAGTSDAPQPQPRQARVVERTAPASDASPADAGQPTPPPDASPTPSKPPGPQGLARLVPAKVSATSSRKGRKQAFAPWRAFDEIHTQGVNPSLTAWCEGARGSSLGERLAIEFAEPIDVGQITVEVGTPDDEGFSASGLGVEIRLDGKGEPLTPKETDGGWIADAAGQAATSITFTIATDTGKEPACIPEIRFSRVSVVPVAKLGPLPDLDKAVQEAQKAFETCDATALAKARYPFTVTHSDGTDGIQRDSTSDRPGAMLRSGPSVNKLNKSKLLSWCAAVSSEDEMGPWKKAPLHLPFRGRALGNVLVYAGLVTVDEAWFMWRFEIHRGSWRLRGVELLGGASNPPK
jgi:hypothetical protein